MRLTIEGLMTCLDAVGVLTKDMIGKLPAHPTKRFDVRSVSDLKGFTFHHTGGPGGGSERFEAVAKYHVGPNHMSADGCPGICYTMGIATDGTVCFFHDFEVKTWSQGTGNENYIGVVFLGNFKSKSNPEGVEPTSQQLFSLMALAEFARVSDFEVTGHFNFGKPACPGETIESVIVAISSHAVPKLNDSLATLEEVQLTLIHLGYNVGASGADGVMGPSTRSAISTFQKDHGLDVDGIAGPATKAALLKAMRPSTVPSS